MRSCERMVASANMTPPCSGIAAASGLPLVSSESRGLLAQVRGLMQPLAMVACGWRKSPRKRRKTVPGSTSRADNSAAVSSETPTSTRSSLAARASSPSPPRTLSPAVLGTDSGRARDLSSSTARSLSLRESIYYAGLTMPCRGPSSSYRRGRTS